MATYHNESDHALISVDALTDLLVHERPDLCYCEAHMLTQSTDTKAYARLNRTSRLLDSLECVGPAKNEVVLSDFCHLHLPAFVRAFRATARDGEQAPTLDDELCLGPDDHVWTPLWLIVRTPLFSRYVFHHPESAGLVADAIQFASVVLKELSRRLKTNRQWTVRFVGWAEHVVEALKFLFLVSPCLVFSTCPYSCDELQDPHTQELVRNLDDMNRTLTNTPSKLSEDVKDNVGALRYHLSELRGCLRKRLVHECDDLVCDRDAHKIRRDLPWVRCEGRPEGAARCETDPSIMPMCSRYQAVRYCSHAHQKAHWKKHKLVCKEPIW